MGYVCHECAKKGIYTPVATNGRFIAKDGRVLCLSCAKGVEPCTDKKYLIIDINNNLNKCYYLLPNSNILPKNKITKCTVKNNVISLALVSRNITLAEDIKVTKVNFNLKWCYSLENDGNLLGYICKK